MPLKYIYIYIYIYICVCVCVWLIEKESHAKNDWHSVSKNDFRFSLESASDWQHFNRSKVILCIEVKESRSLNTHINIFVRLLVLSNTNNFLNRYIWAIDGKLKGINTPDQNGPGNNGYKKLLGNVCISKSANNTGKVMNRTILPPATG